jgi:hypothetical protein
MFLAIKVDFLEREHLGGDVDEPKLPRRLGRGDLGHRSHKLRSIHKQYRAGLISLHGVTDHLANDLQQCFRRVWFGNKGVDFRHPSTAVAGRLQSARRYDLHFWVKGLQLQDGCPAVFHGHGHVR